MRALARDFVLSSAWNSRSYSAQLRPFAKARASMLDSPLWPRVKISVENRNVLFGVTSAQKHIGCLGDCVGSMHHGGKCPVLNGPPRTPARSGELLFIR